MASFWEMDPFFPAAEEVQNSTERMEALFWSYKESVARDDAAAAEVSKRDLLTALDTVRWQLQELTRACETTEHVYVGENASTRHAQFVSAIESHIRAVEIGIGCSQQLRVWNRIEEKERESLTLFLSGGNLEEVEAGTAAATSSSSSSSSSSTTTSNSSSSSRASSSGWLGSLVGKYHPAGSSSGLKRWKDGDYGEDAIGDIEQGFATTKPCCSSSSNMRSSVMTSSRMKRGALLVLVMLALFAWFM